MAELLADADRIFLNLDHRHDWRLEGAKARGAWNGVDLMVKAGPDWIIEQIKNAGLRGRGGGGFITANKWAMMPKEDGGARYLIVNADESEPGACKDRQMMGGDPHLVIEGAFLAAYAIRAHTAYIYIRGEAVAEREKLEAAVEEARAARLVGQDNVFGWDFECVVHHGAGAYICGDEMALLESLEGKKGQPRLKPPYPAISGLYGRPTTINNVESIAVVGTILRRGADWFAGFGRLNNAGTKLFSGCGHLNAPGVVEEAMSIPIRTLIETYFGGVRGGWSNLKAIIPGGATCPMITAEQAETMLMDYDSPREFKSMMGTGTMIVMDKSTDLVRAIARISYFFKHESCGQCTPCREGTGWMWLIMERMAVGDAEPHEIDLLLEVASNIEGGHAICGLADAAVWPIQGLFRHFRGDVEDRIASYRARRPHVQGATLIAAE
jgi:NADH-quinone oxidoreductase subunit F